MPEISESQNRLLETFGFEKRLRFFRDQLSAERRRLGRALDVIDVGCGTGEAVTLVVGDDGDFVVGLDVHMPSLLIGQKQGGAQFVCAETAAVRAKSFDVVICSELLEHVDAPAELLAEIRRLLRPQGLCLVTVPNGYGPYEALDRAGKITHMMFRALGLEGEPAARAVPSNAVRDSLNYTCGHLQFFTIQRLRRLFASAGFSEQVYVGRTFVCGTLVSDVLAASDTLVELNRRAGSLLPAQVVSGWMFALRLAEKSASQPGLRS